MTDEGERFLVLRFTDRERIKEFYQVLEDSGFLDNVNKVGGEEKAGKVPRKDKSEGSSKNGSYWSDLGMSHYDDKGAEKISRVVDR